ADSTADHVYGVSTTDNALVVVNTVDGSARQEFKDGQNGVSGLAGAESVVSGSGFVIVGGGTSGSLATFRVDQATGKLIYVTSRTDGGDYYDSMRYDSASRTLTTVGADGTRTYHLGSTGVLSGPTTEAGSKSEEIRQAGNVYTVDAATDTLNVTGASGSDSLS